MAMLASSMLHVSSLIGSAALRASRLASTKWISALSRFWLAANTPGELAAATPLYNPPGDPAPPAGERTIQAVGSPLAPPAVAHKAEAHVPESSRSSFAPL